MSLDNLTGRASRAGRAQASQVMSAGGLVAATIATTPAVGDRVDVLIGGDATQRTGPCVWSPVVIDGELFTPARDDPCFVTFARRGEAVVVWWEPDDDREGDPVGTAGPAGPTGPTGATGSVTPPSFTNLTLLNGWAVATGTARWSKDQHNRVHLDGCWFDGRNATSGVIATLPAGARPGTIRSYPTAHWLGSQWAIGRIRVLADGTIQFHDMIDAFANTPDIFDVLCDHISFSTDA